ncbi:MAG TPA: ANTAR domain-containing protein, partial [Nitriliruptorales bacterium]
VVLGTQAGSQDAELAWPLDDAATRRAVVHQATGAIAVQVGCTVEEALVRLRAHAYANDEPIVDVARKVMDKSVRFSP